MIPAAVIRKLLLGAALGVFLVIFVSDLGHAQGTEAPKPPLGAPEEEGGDAADSYGFGYIHFDVPCSEYGFDTRVAQEWSPPVPSSQRKPTGNCVPIVGSEIRVRFYPTDDLDDWNQNPTTVPRYRTGIHCYSTLQTLANRMRRSAGYCFGEDKPQLPQPWFMLDDSPASPAMYFGPQITCRDIAGNCNSPAAYIGYAPETANAVLHNCPQPIEYFVNIAYGAMRPVRHPSSTVYIKLEPPHAALTSIEHLWDGVYNWGGIPDPSFGNAYNLFMWRHIYFTPKPSQSAPCNPGYNNPKSSRNNFVWTWYRDWGWDSYIEKRPHDMFHVYGSTIGYNQMGRTWGQYDPDPGPYQWDVCVGSVAGSPCCSTSPVRISDQVPQMTYICASCTMIFLGEPSCKQLRWRIMQGQARVASPLVWDGSSYQLQLTDRHDRQQDPAMVPITVRVENQSDASEYAETTVHVWTPPDNVYKHISCDSRFCPTPAEARLILAFPELSSAAIAISIEGLALAAIWFPQDECHSDGSIGNAFLHSFLNCQLTRVAGSFSLSCGGMHMRN